MKTCVERYYLNRLVFEEVVTRVTAVLPHVSPEQIAERLFPALYHESYQRWLEEAQVDDLATYVAMELAPVIDGSSEGFGRPVA